MELSISKEIIDKDESIKLNVNIIPEEAKENKIIYKSSNTSVAIVDEKGNILGVSSGDCNITVSNENGKVSKSIKITVYSPVTDVYINSGDIRLREGEIFKLSAIIEPEDSSNKRVRWESLNTDVATITQEGEVNAIKEGIAQIKVITEDGSKEKSIQLIVGKNVIGTEIKFDSSLKIDGSEITGIDYLDTSAQGMKKKINTGYIIEIYNHKNELLDDSLNIGTGSRIVFKDSNADIIDEFNILLYGDVNGDGKINTVDLLLLQRHILKLQRIEGLFLKSGNVLKNEKNPSTIDMLKIQRHILKLEILSQGG